MYIQTFFSSETSLRDVILEHVELANESIYIAVAWFTDPTIFNAVLEKLYQGVKVEVVITNHKFNWESPNDFEEINRSGGFFGTCGNDESLMHNKFCVIDHNYILNGSFNYSKRANRSNQENLTVISGDPLHAQSFYREFQKIKELAGFQKEFEEQISLSECIKHLNTIRTFIQIGEVNYAFPFANKIKEVSQVSHIYDSIIKKKYDQALKDIDVFLREFSQLISVGVYERDYLRTQIRLISKEILILEVEKVEIENQIGDFNHRYTIELFPWVSKILALKKKISQKLKKHGVKSSEFEEAERQYEEAISEFKEESEKDIPDLDIDEKEELKKLYREAVKYCHPDSSERKIEDIKEASRIFAELTDAYHNKDLDRVRSISQKLKNGELFDDLEAVSELETLTARLQTLKAKLEEILFEIYQMRASEEFKVINSGDLDEFFKEKKLELEKTYAELINKYGKNGG